MVMRHDADLGLPYLIKKNCTTFFLVSIGLFLINSQMVYCAQPQTMTYHMSIAAFESSLIEIPTSNVSVSSPTIASNYIAGRAPIYDVNNQPVGICSASFLSIETADGIFTDISNYVSIDNGLIVTWFTPTRLANLEFDTIVNGMVTDCIVQATTKIGDNPFFGQTFNLVVSSDGTNIYFQFTRTGMIF